jgi:serine/threonine protein phosphatase 1
MKNPLKALPVNQLGRDFVIGDLHGSYSALTNLLKNIHFDPVKDRLISVGDLCDRGPDSLHCLQLLSKPWFHAVLSNHEQMMIEAFNGGYMGNFWIKNGGDWGLTALTDHRMRVPNKELSADTKELFNLLPYVEELPYLITVNCKNNKKFHVMHAELPPGTRPTDSDLSSPGKVLELATTQNGDGEAFLWSRYIFGSFHGMDISAQEEKVWRSASLRGNVNQNLSHIISGHTPVQRPLTIFGQTNIDTMAFASYGKSARKWAALTCVELETWKFYQATESSFRETSALTIC